MLLYRIGKTKFANDLSGEGSRLYGGRWNQPGTSCVYCAQSRALALLEYTVNVNIEDIPRALSITEIEILNIQIKEFNISELPGNWDGIPSPSSTKDFGTKFLNEGEFGVFKIPSAIIPQEYNYLLNPLHADRGKFKILSVQDFIFDTRIKLV